MKLFALFVWTLCVLAPPGLTQQKAEATLYHRVEGSEVRVAIEIAIDPHWHLYHDRLGPPDAVGKPTRVTLLPEEVEWGPVVFPEPERYEQPGVGADGGDTWIQGHEGTIVLHARGTLADGADEPEVEAELTGLTCKDGGQCVPYSDELESEGAGDDELFAFFERDAGADDSVAAAAEEEQLGREQVSGRLYVRTEGEDVRAVLALEVAKDWHVYHTELGNPDAIGIPSTVELRGEGVDWNAPRFPEAHRYDDPWGSWYLVHDGEVLITATGRKTGAAAPSRIAARLEGQACKTQCVQVALTFADAGEGSDALFERAFAQKSASRAESASGGRTPRRESKDDGLLAFLLLAIGGGLFALMMPCTYPMIPITISFFTKQAETRKGNVLPLSLTYGVGIVAIFVLIGVVVGPVILSFATHPVTNLAIGLLFLFFSLALFGVITIQPPQFLMSAAGRASSQGGFFGVFLMGATLVVTSFTCTAPFVGSLLAAGAVSGEANLARIALGMGVFGLTMAVPFVFLSLLPGRMHAIPRSGEWMNTLKVSLGFVEVAAAMKFLSNADLVWGWHILSRELFLLLWAGTFLLAGVYLLNWIRLRGHAEEEIGAGRMVGAMIFLALAGYCWHGYKGAQLDPIMTAIIPPYSSLRVDGGGEEQASAGSARARHTIVVDDYEGALARARAEDKLLLINFTGHT